MSTTPTRRAFRSGEPVTASHAPGRHDNRLIRRSLQRATAHAAATGARPTHQITQEDEMSEAMRGGTTKGLPEVMSDAMPDVMLGVVAQSALQDEASQVDELTVLRAVAADAATYFRACLQDPTTGRRARRTLAARGLPILTPADGIGYAPEGWNGLTTHLQGMGYSDEHLLAAGVSTRSRNSQLLDRFRARITFAIHDVAGDVVGFTARAFDEDRAAAAATDHDLPKYLNTHATSLYRKRELLYGFTPQARELLRAGALPVLVEGPTDALAITLAGAGRRVGIASCGTALTSEHLTFLEDVLRTLSTHDRQDCQDGQAEGEDLPLLHAQGLAVAFDSDTAGRAAAHRAWELTTVRGLRPLEVLLPEGADPASLARTHLSELLETIEMPLNLSLIRDAVRPWADRLHEDTSQLHAVRAAVRLIDPTYDDLDLGRCLTAVAAATGADMTCVIDEVLDYRANGTPT
ncbi:toprim domain-containing protein [Kineococcus sp. R86509]|uniref:toprim domain-containing protein n=1 Tax=Kineococcus sp. R86509 TaxID=3093851 RepID=UPI0036D3631C